MAKLGAGGVCKITNDKFSWVLEVDGKTITFNGTANADYFAELYTKLGYSVELETTKLVCPRCSKKYSGESALSRKDNKTKICSICAQLEALEDFSWKEINK